MPVQWVDAPAVGPLPLVICGAHAPSRVVFGAAPKAAAQAILFRSAGRRPMRAEARALPAPDQYRRSLRAFTLLELMMVVAIVGFVAVLTLPHVRGFGQANAMTAATRQLLDDVALARQRAMVNRSTVYMVFVPPQFWTYTNFQGVVYDQAVATNKQELNLLKHQYGAYALISLGSIGDQPGQHHPRYVTDWRFLPDGVFISPFEFALSNAYLTNIYTTNTLSGIIVSNGIYGWGTASVPFPSLPTPTGGLPTATTMSLPCIAFSPQGGLSTQYTNQYIVLARGSVLYPTDTNGVPLFAAPIITETPPNNDINNPNLIQIDWMTARATLVQNQLQ